MTIEVIVPESARKTYTDWRFAPAVRHQDLVFPVVGQANRRSSAALGPH